MGNFWLDQIADDAQMKKNLYNSDYPPYSFRAGRLCYDNDLRPPHQNNKVKRYLPKKNLDYRRSTRWPVMWSMAFQRWYWMKNGRSTVAWSKKCFKNWRRVGNFGNRIQMKAKQEIPRIVSMNRMCDSTSLARPASVTVSRRGQFFTTSKNKPPAEQQRMPRAFATCYPSLASALHPYLLLIVVILWTIPHQYASET